MATWQLSGTTSWTRRTSTQPLGDGRWSHSRDSSAKLLWSSPLTWFVSKYQEMSLCQTPNHILLWRNQLQLPWFRSFGGEFLLGRPSREKRCFCLSEFLFSLSLLLRRVSLIFLLVLTCFLCCKWKEEGGGWWSCSQVYWLKSWKSWWQRRRWSWKGGWCPQGGRHSSWKRWDDNLENYNIDFSQLSRHRCQMQQWSTWKPTLFSQR